MNKEKIKEINNLKLENAIIKYSDSKREWLNKYELAKQTAREVNNNKEVIIALYNDDNKEQHSIDYFYNYDEINLLSDNSYGKVEIMIFTSTEKYMNASINNMVGAIIEISEIRYFLSQYNFQIGIMINPSTDNKKITGEELSELVPLITTFAEFNIDTIEFENILKSDRYIEDMEADVCRIYDLFSERIVDFCSDSKYFEDGIGLESDVFSYVFVMNIISQFIINYNSKNLLKVFDDFKYDNNYYISLREIIIKALNEHIINDYDIHGYRDLVHLFHKRVKLYDDVLSGNIEIGGHWITDSQKFDTDLYAKMILLWGDTIFYPETIDDYRNYYSYPIKGEDYKIQMEKEMETIELRNKVNQCVFIIGDWISALLKENK